MTPEEAQAIDDARWALYLQSDAYKLDQRLEEIRQEMRKNMAVLLPELMKLALQNSSLSQEEKENLKEKMKELGYGTKDEEGTTGADQALAERDQGAIETETTTTEFD